MIGHKRLIAKEDIRIYNSTSLMLDIMKTEMIKQGQSSPLALFFWGGKIQTFIKYFYVRMEFITVILNTLINSYFKKSEYI